MKTAYDRILPAVRALLSVAVLLICLFYTLTAIYLTSYPGFDWDSDGTIQSLETCTVDPDWCEANQDVLQIGDRILAFGDLTIQEYNNDLTKVPFAGYEAGDTIRITFLRDGKEQTTDWRMPGHTNMTRLRYLWYALPLFIPFWLVGTVALFLPRLRTQSLSAHWLPILFSFFTALWLAIGAFGSWRSMYRGLVVHALTWLLIPIYWHFHLDIPSPLVRGRRRIFLVTTYVATGILAILELLQLLPSALGTLGMLLAFSGSVGMLLYRLLARRVASERPTTALMLAGICLALGPSIVLWVIPTILNTPIPAELAAFAPQISVPLLPFAYAYAIYKRRLGSWERHAIRVLGFYGFLIAYSIIIIVAISLAGFWLGNSANWVAFIGAALTLFALAAVPLYARFQRLLNRMAYGTLYNPYDIIHAFATKISSITDHKAWVQSLADELAANLFIRQSALYLITEQDIDLIYAQGVDMADDPMLYHQIEQMLPDAGRYRPPSRNVDQLAWVRLVLPLEIRGKVAGVWLFGQRDPDDYYPSDDIKVLSTLAGQVAIAVENDRLYNRALEEIAERELSEQALRESEEQLRLIAQNMPIMLDAMDKNGNFVVWNRECERVTGYGAQEIVDNPRALELLYPDEEYRLEITSEWSRRGSDFRDWELDLTAKDGSTKTVAWYNISGRLPIPGWATWAVGIDVSERRQIERSLRESEEMLRVVLNASTESVLLIDAQGTILTLNQTAAERLGRSVGELVGLRSRDLLSQSILEADLLSSRLATVAEVVRTGAPAQVEDERAGRILDTTYYPITGAEGQVTHLAVFSRDVTAQRQAEQRAIKDERLAAMGQMATALTDEVNNPLQTVRSNLELLQTFDLEQDEYSQRLDIALKEIERLAGITRRVLDFVQPTKDALDTVDIAQLVRKAATLRDKQLERARIELSTSFSAEPVFVTVTPSQMVQVLHNVIDTAIEIMPSGGRLQITGHPNGDKVTLEVSNDRTALTPEQVEHLFDPFFSTEPGDAKLGLYTSRIIVEQHRGTIKVGTLEESQGVVFTITLPVTERYESIP
jgi:two-component system, sporulation sensor kinase E